MTKAPAAPDLFAALQEQNPCLDIDGTTYWILEGDLLLDRNQLWAYALGQVEQMEQPAGPSAAAQQLVMAADAAGRIVRWRKGKILTYFVRRSSFGDQEQYDFVVKTVRAACADWEAVCGVNFKHLVELDAGMAGAQQAPLFDVVGVPIKSPLIASAFFPNWEPARRHLYIYPSFFDPEPYYDCTGVLRHELGHVLGFRHEHIRTVAPANCPKELLDHTFNYGAYDPQSVMHYFCGGVGTRDMNLTKVDREGARFVYGPPDSEVAYYD